MAEYGSFGQANYDDGAKEWTFNRAGQGSGLRQIGNSKFARQPTAELIRTRTAGSKQTQHEIKALVRAYPDLQPASDILGGFERVSKATEDATTHHDPVKGELLAFGSIPSRTHRGSVDVVAFAAGSTGSELRLARLTKQNRTIDNSFSIDVPSISNEEAIWKGPGVPIQSICFARPATANDANFIAVRLITEIVIFQPDISGLTPRESPKIELNLTYRLKMDGMANLPYSHVTFNPYLAWQFAFIDQAGSWTVMEIDEAKIRGVTSIHRNELIDNTENDMRAPVDDGWGRIIWVGTSTILATCNRRRLVLFDQESSASDEVPVITSVLDDRVTWNLDIVVLHSKSNVILLLTTGHLVLYHVIQGYDENIVADRVLCTRHYRNAGDLSLRLHVCDDDDDTLVFIRSDLDAMVIFYRLDLSDPERIAFSDPMALDMASILGSVVTHGRVTSMHVARLPSTKQDNSQSNFSSSKGAAPNHARFYLITTLHQDMSVLETLYMSGTDGSLPTKRNSETHQDLLSTLMQQGKARRTAKTSEDWTISYQHTIRQLANASVAPTSNVAEVFNTTQAKLQSGDIGLSVLNETLQEQFINELEVDDLEDNSRALRNLHEGFDLRRAHEVPPDDIDATETSGPPILSAITWPANLHTEDALDPAALHLTIVDNWVSPLSDNVSDATRSVQEQYALRIAAEVALARLVVRLEEPPQSQSMYSQNQGYNFELPVRTFGAPGSSRLTPSVYFDASSQPQSSARATPSSPGTPSSAASFDQPLAISRLGRYINFSNPPTTALPRSLNRVLTHWTLGADPADYDWRSATRQINRRAEEEEGEELTERERVRLQRRRERHERRQQRHEEERRRQEMLNSQPPEIFTGSQPTQITTSYGFSQATGGTQMPGSQILPGRHGGRPPPKKKRKSGF